MTDLVALNLHGFYAGLERTFEPVATTVDGQMPLIYWAMGPNGLESIENGTPRMAQVAGSSV